MSTQITLLINLLALVVGELFVFNDTIKEEQADRLKWQPKLVFWRKYQVTGDRIRELKRFHYGKLYEIHIE